MNRKKNKDEELDILLGKAFEEYVRREDEALPSDEELREAFPPSEEDCLKYGKAAKRKERGSAALKVLRRVAVIVLALISVTSAALMLNKNVRAAVSGTLIRWTSFFRKFNGTTDYDAWVSFDQGEDGGFYKDVELSDLGVGYVPEGYVLYENTSSYEEFPGNRYIILYDTEMYSDVHGPFGPSSITVHIREGDQEVEYSDEMLACAEETTVNGMSALLFDQVHEIKDGSELNGRKLEVGDLAFGDKNFTIRLHWLAFEDEGSLRDEAIKVAESLG